MDDGAIISSDILIGSDSAAAPSMARALMAERLVELLRGAGMDCELIGTASVPVPDKTQDLQ